MSSVNYSHTALFVIPCYIYLYLSWGFELPAIKVQFKLAISPRLLQHSTCQDTRRLLVAQGNIKAIYCLCLLYKRSWAIIALKNIHFHIPVPNRYMLYVCTSLTMEKGRVCCFKRSRIQRTQKRLILRDWNLCNQAPLHTPSAG